MNLLIRVVVGFAMAALVLVFLVMPACGCRPASEQNFVLRARRNVSADLRTFAASQEVYRREHGEYAGDIHALTRGTWPSLDIPGNMQADRNGFYMEARTMSAPGLRCAIAVGRFTGDSLQAGKPRCQLQGKSLTRLPATSSTPSERVHW